MTRCQVTFSFPNSISLLTLWGDANPRETPILAICINKPGIFPNITHFTQKGLFSPQVLCNFPIPSSTAASLSFSLLLVSLFHLQLAASFSYPPCLITGQYLDFTGHKSPFFPATHLQTTQMLPVPLEKLPSVCLLDILQNKELCKFP